MAEQQREIFFTGDEAVELALGDVRLRPAHRIMFVREAHPLMVRRVLAEGRDVVPLDVLQQLGEKRRAMPAVERVPLHEPIRHHAADMPVVLHEQHRAAFARRAHRTRHGARRAADHDEIVRLAFHVARLRVLRELHGFGVGLRNATRARIRLCLAFGKR